MERQILHVDVNNAFLSWLAVYKLKNGEKIDSCIQFELYNDNTFEICYVDFNGKSQNQDETDNLIRDIMVNTKTKNTNE